MKNKLESWSAKQAIGILSVDNIKPSHISLNLLKLIEDNSISSKEAKEKILENFKEKSLTR